MPRTPLARAATILRRMIRADHPEWWPGLASGRDVVGHQIYFHPPSGGYNAEIVWESSSWVDEAFCERANDALQDAGIPVWVSYRTHCSLDLEDCS